MSRRPPRIGLWLILVCGLAGGIFAASLAQPTYRSEGVLCVGEAPAGSGLPPAQAPWWTRATVECLVVT